MGKREFVTCFMRKDFIGLGFFDVATSTRAHEKRDACHFKIVERIFLFNLAKYISIFSLSLQIL